MIVGGAALGLFLDNYLFETIHTDICFHCVGLIIGLSLIALVIRISKNTGRTLAKYGRKGNLKRLETNVLVQEGIYKYMRHPMHLGLFLFPMSFAFIVGSPSFIVLVAPLEVIFMLIMIKIVEEPETIRKFGDEYRIYKSQTPWFCFKFRCLKELLKDVPKT